MPLSLSTHWNAHRHASGETLIDEILELGLRHVELGYDLTVDLVPGVRQRVESGAVRVTSVHNYCPVPMGAARGHPELYLLATRSARTRDSAIYHTQRTIEFAASLGAACVVAHGGYARLWPVTPRLIALAADGRQHEPKFDRLKQKLLLKRDRKAAKDLEGLKAARGQLLPVLERNQVRLALENLPAWEAVPNEAEMEQLGREFDSPWIGYWHDIGHGQVRENLGFISVLSWLQRLQTWLCGMHVHDVRAPAMDHLVPGAGTVNFPALRPFASPELPLVMEPAPGTPVALVAAGLAALRDAWGMG